jgi:hypothetical protein
LEMARMFFAQILNERIAGDPQNEKSRYLL